MIGDSLDMARTGRPSSYCQEMADKICEEIATGKSLRKTCEPKDMPDRGTVIQWTIKHKDFSIQYASACQVRSYLYADEIIDIADDKSGDMYENGHTNHENINRSRLRVDARKWILSKLLPNKYGDKLDITSKDEKINNPPVINVITKETAEDIETLRNGMV